jgi:hypothetical protein
MSEPIFNSYDKNDIKSEDLKNYYENSRAIIIGINKYKEENSLTNAENDAKAIMKVLKEKYGFTVMKSLFNEEATGDQIREIFIDYLQDEKIIKPKDRVIIYYSGHGKIRVKLGRGNEEIKEGYIVPYDSKRERFSANIPMEDIVKGCQNCPAKHVLLILDCCYSGIAANRAIKSSQGSYVVTENYVKDISSRVAVQVFAAGQEDQPVSDSGIRPGYSAFTGALLDILEPEVDPDNDGILTASEIGRNLERQVAVQEQRGSPYQRPVYSHLAGSHGGDFIFKIFKLKKSTAPPTAPNKSTETISDMPVEIVLTAGNLDLDDIPKFLLVKNPEHGTVKFETNSNNNNDSNRLVYTPYAGFAGEDIFTYKATNSKGVDSNIATIKVTTKLQPLPRQSPPYYPKQYPAVTSIPKTPEVKKHQHQQQSFIRPKVLIPIIAVTAGIIIAFVVFNNPQPPTAPPTPILHTTNPHTASPTSNHFPTAINQNVKTKQNTPLTITLSGSEDPNSILTAKIVSPPYNGTLGSINQDTGNVTYTPNSGFIGTDSFKFKVNDGKAYSDNYGTVYIRVGGR